MAETPTWHKYGIGEWIVDFSELEKLLAELQKIRTVKNKVIPFPGGGSTATRTGGRATIIPFTSAKKQLLRTDDQKIRDALLSIRQATEDRARTKLQERINAELERICNIKLEPKQKKAFKKLLKDMTPEGQAKAAAQKEKEAKRKEKSFIKLAEKVLRREAAERKALDRLREAADKAAEAAEKE